MEDGIGFGIDHDMHDQITLTDGVVDRYSFPDYEPIEISCISNTETHLVPSAEPPTGVGERGFHPAAPASANAISPLRNFVDVVLLPMSESGISFAWLIGATDTVSPGTFIRYTAMSVAPFW